MAAELTSAVDRSYPADVGASQGAVAERRRDPATLILVAAAVVSAALLVARVDYVPMWDGFIYAEAINDAVRWPPSLASLRLAGHASHVYAAMAALAQAMSPGRFWPLLLLNTALFAAACIGFHRLLRFLFPGADRRIERALMTMAFAFQPALLAGVVQPGIDLPLVPGFVWCTVLVLERRWVPAIVIGIAMAFTKETGILLYAVLVATYALWTLVRSTGGWRDRLSAVLRLAPLVIPGLVFGVYLLVRRYGVEAGEPVVWNAGTAMIKQGLLRQLLVPRVDRYLLSFMGLMGILNFSWIITVFGAVAGFGVVRRLARAAPWRRRMEDARALLATPTGFVVLLAALSAYALTRFATYANARYVLPFMALAYVVFLAALFDVVRRPALRRAILAAFAALLLVSAVRTVDPVSRALWGTFPFGERAMLRMTRITHECCGMGRDQLVYNLEFTTLEALTSDALSSIAADDSSVVILPDLTNWYVASRVDPATHRRTVVGRGGAQPTLVEDDSVAATPLRYRRAHYIALPNAQWARGLERLRGLYDVQPPRHLRRGSYTLAVYPLVPRWGVRGTASVASP